MKKYIYYGAALLICILAIRVGVQSVKIARLEKNNQVLTRNQTALLSENESYKVADSLNAVSTLAKELRISELEKYRAEDMALIKQLRAEKSEIKSISTAQLEAAYALKSVVRDSIVFRDRPDTVKCTNYSDKWIDLTVCFDNEGIADCSVVCRDELLYIEHVKRARFLGFLWKTKRIKERRQEIVSRNPHTTITDAEFISIRDN